MNWPAAVVIIAFIALLGGLLWIIGSNDNLTEVEETKRMTACVEAGGQWLENEGMSAKMECVRR